MSDSYIDIDDEHGDIEALYTHYETAIALLTDTLSNLKATIALNNWRGAEYCYRQNVKRGPVSYSVAGSSYQFESTAAATNARDTALADLEGILGYSGATSYVNMGGDCE